MKQSASSASPSGNVDLKPADIRKARGFLRKRGIETKDISPRAFLAASRELETTFAETLKVIASLSLAGQGEGPAPRAQKLAEKDR